MTWLTWRQMRVQASFVLTMLAALVVALIVTAHGLRSDYRVDITTFIDGLQFQRFQTFLYLAGLVATHSVAPVVGGFWGAPLIARELEAGTHRLVWNQGTTRNRWLAMKVAVTGGIAVVAVLVLGWVVSWWSRPIDKAIAAGHGSGTFSLPRMDPVVFGARGIVVVGYVLLGLAVGVTAGLVLRRSLPAVGLTLVLLGALEILVPQFVRPHLVAPVTANVVISTENLRGLNIRGEPGQQPPGAVHLTVRAGGPGDRSLTNATVDKAGAAASPPGWFAECVHSRIGPPIGGVAEVKARAAGRNSLDPCFARLADEGYRQHVTYQPASTFWTLQLRETGLLLVLAGLLFGFCFWRIGRDVS